MKSDHVCISYHAIKTLVLFIGWSTDLISVIRVGTKNKIQVVYLFLLPNSDKPQRGLSLALFSNNPAVRPAGHRPAIRTSSNLILQEAEIQYASSIWLNKKKYAKKYFDITPPP